MIALILSRQLLVCLYRADVPANIVSPIIGLLVLDRCLSYYWSINLRFIKARPILSLSFIYRFLIFNIGALLEPSFIDWSLLIPYWTDNQTILHQPIFNMLKLRRIPVSIIGSDFGANITSRYKPSMIIQVSIDHRSNINSQHWLPTLEA